MISSSTSSPLTTTEIWSSLVMGRPLILPTHV